MRRTSRRENTASNRAQHPGPEVSAEQFFETFYLIRFRKDLVSGFDSFYASNYQLIKKLRIVLHSEWQTDELKDRVAIYRLYNIWWGEEIDE